MLNPGETYYWKIQAIDGSSNLTKLISDNTNIASFSINQIELSFPDNGSYDISLAPLFSWDAPIGVNSYIIEFTTEEDLDFQNIIFSSNSNSSFFLSSNVAGSLPFENGTTYLWRIKPINNNGEEGKPSNSFSFSTILDLVLKWIQKNPDEVLTLIMNKMDDISNQDITHISPYF